MQHRQALCTLPETFIRSTRQAQLCRSDHCAAQTTAYPAWPPPLPGSGTACGAVFGSSCSCAAAWLPLFVFFFLPPIFLNRFMIT